MLPVPETGTPISNMSISIKHRVSLNIILCLVFTLAFMGGCSPEADEPQELEDTGSSLQEDIQSPDYENNKYGLAFDYLDSWSLKDEEDTGEALYLTLAYQEEGKTSDSARIIISVIEDESLSQEQAIQDLVNTLGEVEVKEDGPSAIKQYDAHYFEAVTLSPEPLWVKTYIIQEKESTFIFTGMAQEDKVEALVYGFTEVLTTLELN